MKTQLFFDLTAETSCPSVHFQESRDVEEIIEELQRQNIGVFVIDGAALSSRKDIFKAFATALKKPNGWYGDEEYADNADAFLEYLDDVSEWVLAKGRVVLVRGSEQLWRSS
ncbi:MAG: barstar family protein [Terriglobales bacterium]|jgi:hypothetical protein